MIVGSGRCGTTLMRSMLNAHPEVAVPPELPWYRFGQRWGRAWHTRAGFDPTIPALVLETRTPWLDRSGLSVTEIQDHMDTVRPTNWPDYVRALLALYARRQGKARYGDKTPNSVRTLPGLAEMFPEARFLHLIRDARDVARSYLDASFGPSSAVDAALAWRRDVGGGRAAGRILGPARYREITYEALVDRPEEVLRDVCAFFDLQFHPAMLEYHRAPPLIDRREHANLTLPPTPGLGRQRTPLTGLDNARVEVLCGRLLTDCGYPIGSRPPAPVRLSTHARAWALRLRLRWRELRRLARIRWRIHRLRAGTSS
jgi:hypothetical protein